MFTFETITTLFKIYEQEEFNVLNFGIFSEVVKCPLFVDYIKGDSEDRMRDIDAVFNIYFNGLAATRLNVNPVVFKNKVCTLLKMNLRIPAYRGGISIKNVQVNVSNNYKPAEISKITATSDIGNVIKHTFFNSINISGVETFTFAPQMANVIIQGPILRNVMNSIVNMQAQCMQIAKAHGVQVQPFIENTKNKFSI